MAKMFVRYSGNKAAFQAAGLETTYAKSIVFIGGGECIWANGNYYASSAEIQEVVDGFSWFSQISDGTHTAKTNAKDGVITFSAIDPASVEVLVDAYGVKFGLKEEFVNAVNEVLPARIKAIEDDYLKGADKTELQGNIDAVIGTAEDTMESKTIEGLYKRIDEKTSGIASEGVVTDLSNRVKAIEDAPYATTDNVATAKSEVIGTEGDAATADTVKGAKAFATSAVNTAKTEILGAVEEADAKTIAALNDKIEAVSADAKSYSIAKVEGTELEALGANVKEAFKLVDEDGAQAGNVIAIYKDSSVKEVKLVEQELQITYILADGSESTVGIDVSKFLAESEFAEGLQVVNGVVSVKVDPTSEEFLSVSSDGVKVSGITEALDTKIGKEDVMLPGEDSVFEDVLSADKLQTKLISGDAWKISMETTDGYTGSGASVYTESGELVVTANYNYGGKFEFECKDGMIYAKTYSEDAGSWFTSSAEAMPGVKYYISLNHLNHSGNVAVSGVITGVEMNTSESFVYLKDVLDDKIGKDDVMLSISGISSTIDMTQGSRTPLLSGDWDVEIDSTGHYYGNHKIYKENGEVVYTFIGDGPYVHNVKYSCRGGHIGIYSVENEGISGGNPIYSGGNANYYIELTNDTQAVATIKSYDEVEVNTKTSIEYLNENKADKSEVESSLALKADKAEVEASIAEVESTVSIINETLSTKLDASAFEWEEL